MEIKRPIYLQKLIDRRENGLIKVVTGMRRCGKSYLLNKLFYDHLIESGISTDHIIKFAFDSESDLSLIGEDFIGLHISKRKVDPHKFSEYIKSKTADNGMYYLLLDEVQEMEAFEYVLNGYLYKSNVDVYVTGSNSKFLSTDIITEFRGRSTEVRVYPFSFAEFLSGYNGDKHGAWRDYCIYGGLPSILTMQSPQIKAEYLNDLFRATYIRDLVERNDIQGEYELGQVIDVLASAIGSLSNPQKIYNTFLSGNNKGASKPTISKYIDYLTDAFIISCAKRYDIKGRKYIGSPQKYYFTDIGLRNVRLNFRQTEQTHIMENIIYNELLVRGMNVDVGIVEHRQRTAEGKQSAKQLEVDFVCNLTSQRYYVQSAFSIPDGDKMAQECASLDRIDDSFRKIIVVQDNVPPLHNDKGYLVINILDFLLDPNSLDL